MKNNKPPKLAELLLKLFLSKEEYSEKLGDLHEGFNFRKLEKKYFKSYIWYWKQVLLEIPKSLKHSVLWSLFMLKNYLKISLRNSLKQKSFSIINIAGLAIGMTCFFLIFLWVQDELSYDRFHENADYIYRINSITPGKGDFSHIPETPPPLANVLKDEIPGVDVSTRLYRPFSGWHVSYKDKVFVNDRLMQAEPVFFEMFDYKFLKGNPETALSGTYSIVLTESMAKKYFGSEDPMGKMIKIYRGDFEVTGILKDIPKNSSFIFDCIFPYSYWRDVRNYDLNDWSYTLGQTFIRINKNVSEKEINKKIEKIIQEHSAESKMTLYLQPLTKIHLYTDFSHEFWGMGKGINDVYTFSIIGILVLLIACINFMNLSTARSGKYAKEIGIRKVSGAYKNDIIKQFFSESLLFSTISFVFAVILTIFLLPAFNSISGKTLSLNFSGNTTFIFWMLAISIFTGVTAGSYPAFYLSSFNPHNVLKGLGKSGGKIGKNVRKILVVSQFAVTAVLIIHTTVITRQLDYAKNKYLGYDWSNLLLFDRDGMFGSNFEAAKNELLQNPNILSVSASRWPVSVGGRRESNIDWEGKDPSQEVLMNYMYIDYDYLDTYDLKIAEGRFISKEYATDTSNYLLNEEAVKVMGIESPVGKRFSFRGREGKIIGIIKNFHHASFRHPIEPLFFKYSEESYFFGVKVKREKFSETMNYLEEKWKKFAPGHVFKYRFVEDTISRFYEKDDKLRKIINHFSVLAVFISCMGLFGLALYMAESKTKEIGIRKALGSSITGIVFLLSREFLKWIITANIIAWPIAYFLGKNWLEDFIYRTGFDWWIFVLSGLLTILIAFFTVSYHTIKAGRANPVDTLRYE